MSQNTIQFGQRWPNVIVRLELPPKPEPVPAPEPKRKGRKPKVVEVQKTPSLLPLDPKWIQWHHDLVVRLRAQA